MPIITIYQGSSGSGQELAEAVAKELGYRCTSRREISGVDKVKTDLTLAPPELA